MVLYRYRVGPQDSIPERERNYARARHLALLLLVWLLLSLFPFLVLNPAVPLCKFLVNKSVIIPTSMVRWLNFACSTNEPSRGPHADSQFYCLNTFLSSRPPRRVLLSSMHYLHPVLIFTGRFDRILPGSAV